MTGLRAVGVRLGSTGLSCAGLVLLAGTVACGSSPDETESTAFVVQELAPTSAPTQLAPSGTGASRTPTFSWTSVATATGYDVEIEDGSVSGGVIQRTYTATQAGCAGGGNCSAQLTTALAAGLAKWRIRGSNTDGPGPWSGWVSFAVCVGTLPPTGRPTLISPTGRIETNLPTYNFTSVADATKYFLWVDGPLSADILQVFTAAEAGCVGAANDCAVTPTTAVAVGTSKWWVQAQNAAGSGPWSTNLSFIYGGVAPPDDQPVTISPTGTISTTTPTYKWNALPTANRYTLWVNDASGPKRVKRTYNSGQAGCSSGGVCSVTPPETLARGIGQWWVRGENSAGNGPWSNAVNFTVSGGPPAPTTPPTLIAPSGTISTTTPTYSWNSVTNATEYYLWVNDHDGISIQQSVTATAAGCASGGVCAFTPSTAVASGTSTWWVRAQNAGGTTGWSVGLTFNAGGGSPPTGMATLVAPVGSADSATPAYEWTAVTNATEYLLWVNDVGGTRVQRVYTATEAGCGDGTCSVTPSTELFAGIVTWWIRADNSAGPGPWSEGASFAFCSTSALTAAPVLIAPTGTVSNNPTYQWSSVAGATDYTLWVDDSSRKGVVNSLLSAAASGCPDGGNCAVTPGTTLAAGACKFWVKAQNSMGPGPWSTQGAFTVP